MPFPQQTHLCSSADGTESGVFVGSGADMNGTPDLRFADDIGMINGFVASFTASHR